MKKIKYVLLAVLSAITFLFSSTDVGQMNHVVNGPEAYSKNNNSNDYATHKDDTSYETITLPALKAKSSNYSLYKERVTNNGDRFETHNPIEGVDFVTVITIEFWYRFYDGKIVWLPTFRSEGRPDHVFREDIIPYSQQYSYVLGTIYNVYEQSDIGELML